MPFVGKNNMSYNRRTLFGKLALVCQQYRIERSEIRLDSGGAALFYHLRDKTSDIDVSVDGVVFDRLVEENNLTPRLLPMLGTHPSVLMFTLGGVDFHRVEHLYESNCRFHRHFRIQTQCDLLRFKIRMGRDKDLSDIKALEAFWGELDAFETNRLNKLMERHHEFI